MPEVRAGSELANLAEIGRALLEAPLDEDYLSELIYRLTAEIVPADSFQLGLIDGDRYDIRVWVKDGERQPPAVFPLPEGEGIIRWMEQSRSPLLVRDFHSEMEVLPARPTYISAKPPRSAIFLPMVVGERVIGAISVQSPRAHAFDESHLRVLSVLANQSAAALSNARLYQHGLQRLNALMAVSEVGRRLTRILDLNDLLTQVVELIRSRLGYYHVQVYLVERGTDRAHFKASTGSDLNEKWRREGRSFTIGREGIIGWVAKQGKPLLANDVTQEPRYIPDDPRLLPDTRAELAVPLSIEGEVLGVLDVQSTETDAFGPDDIFTLQTLADQVAVAVNSARAYEIQREEAWVTTVLLQVAEAAAQAEDLTDVLNATVRVTSMLAGAAKCIAWLWDEDGQAFEYGASYGITDNDRVDARASLRFAPGDWQALDRLRAEQASMVILPGETDLPAALRDPCAEEILALLPMLNRGAIFGVLGVSFAPSLEVRLTERRLAMLNGIAQQAAGAVDNARLALAREEEAWISTLLLQVSDIIRQLQPLESTLSQVARLVPALTGVERCAILLRDGQGALRVRAVAAPDDASAAAYENLVLAPGDLMLLDDACRLGQPLVVDDVRGNPRIPGDWEEKLGSRTLLVMPLMAAEDPIGALLVDDVHSTHLFSPRRVRILSGIANQAAIAIENARLQAQEAESARLNREMELGHEIQRSLLPQAAPQVPGYEIAYLWQSAREVGGDFFDFIPLSPERLGMVIADVSDKGIPAALYMMFARTLLRAVAMGGREPSAALERSNELMISDSASDMFVTAYYGILDTVTHRMTVASAGHNLAIYAPANGDPPVPLTTHGIPLGVAQPAGVDERQLDLSPGDVVLLYTDGVTEATAPDGQLFGDERLLRVVAEGRGLPAQEIAAAIAAAVHGFAGDEAPADDLALIVLKRDMT